MSRPWPRAQGNHLGVGVLKVAGDPVASCAG